MKAFYTEKTIKDTMAELENIFESLNTELFNNEIEPIFITIQSQGTKKGVLGWASIGDFWINEDRGRRELNISAEYLKRPIKDIVGTLIHEMVHIHNLQNEVEDCTGQGYHNKKFQKTCDNVGLLAENKGTYHGFAFTSYIENGRAEMAFNNLSIDMTCFSFSRVDFLTWSTGKGNGLKTPIGFKPPTKAPTKMKKWSCSCTNVRCAVELSATCQSCGDAFELQS